MKDTNLTGYGISGVYELKRSEHTAAKKPQGETAESQSSEQELLDAVHHKYYSHWTEKEMLNEIENRKQFLELCTFYSEVMAYLEIEYEKTDISSVVEPLYYTDYKVYQEQDFDNVPPLIIHLAKNEIYARHGYIFRNEDLNNYFNGQLWYKPTVTPENFNDSLFNTYEQVNLRLLTKMDTYQEASLVLIKETGKNDLTLMPSFLPVLKYAVLTVT